MYTNSMHIFSDNQMLLLSEEEILHRITQHMYHVNYADLLHRNANTHTHTHMVCFYHAELI